jgi:hypothetical protein
VKVARRAGKAACGQGETDPAKAGSVSLVSLEETPGTPNAGASADRRSRSDTPYLIHSAIRIAIQIVSRTKLKMATRPALDSRILSSKSRLYKESVELRASPGK